MAQVSNFNLLATTQKGLEKQGISEMLEVLRLLGDEEARAWATEVKGLILGFTNIDPKEAVKKIREIIAKEPWRITYVQRFVPIEITTTTSLSAIADTALELAKKINENETFRITIEKRHTNLSSKDIIEAVAPKINRKVDLEQPDWTILIEIVGPQTGISLVKKGDIVSVMKIKRGEV